MSGRSRARLLAFAVVLPLLMGVLGCEGDGAGSDGLVIRVKSPPNCVAVGNPFPSGMGLLSSSTTLAASTMP